MPDELKVGMESLCGLALDHVRVHYNSDRPAEVQALAFARGSEIHVAPGQERHLPHEVGHVVQQAQGRVRATTQFKEKIDLNDDAQLEREADRMGSEAVSLAARIKSQQWEAGSPPVAVESRYAAWRQSPQTQALVQLQQAADQHVQRNQRIEFPRPSIEAAEISLARGTTACGANQLVPLQTHTVGNSGLPVLQRKILPDHLNLVGEDHEETDPKRAELEKQMISQRAEWNFGPEQYWDEMTFRYDGGDEISRLGDDPRLSAMGSVAEILRHVQDCLQEAKTFHPPSQKSAIAMLGNRLPALRTSLREIREAFGAFEWAVEQAQKEGTAEQPGLVDVGPAAATLDAFRIAFNEIELGQSDQADEAAIKRFGSFNARLKVIEPLLHSVLTQNAALLDEVDLKRSGEFIEDSISKLRSFRMADAALSARENEKRVGIWKIGDRHITDLLKDDVWKEALPEVGVTLTSEADFDLIYKQWLAARPPLELGKK